MIDSLYRLFKDARPIDDLILAVDFLVLAVIVWVEVGEKWHKRTLRCRVSELVHLLEKGQKLQSSTPSRLASSDGAPSWIEEVGRWSAETQDFLASRSSRASFAFMHVVNAAMADREVHRSDGTAFYLGGAVADIYQVLQVKLDNLQRIMEKPEAYF
jgi:hypothetical protein